MARAFTDGLSLVVNFTLFTPIGFMLDLANKKRIFERMSYSFLESYCSTGKTQLLV